jgi:basic membrane protein A
VGAVDNALVRRWLAGYQQGVEDTDAGAKVDVGWAGSYTDPATSKELALAQAQKGAKYIAGVAAAGNAGVFEAAADRNFFTSGVDIDERPKDPEHIILSMVKRSDLAVKDAVCAVGKDTFKGGDVVLGVKEGAVGPDFLTLPEDELELETKLPDAVQAKLKELKDQIAAGEITVADQ